ncbi:MAG: UDP-glucose 4-epimerase GalE [Bacteroidia bacterium]|nr:UDP-glucose 4-epimerase GalE [Bacteroidia bacterium]
MKPIILITGGSGYIGSHTAIELINEGRYEVVSLDSHVNSSNRTLDRIEEITGTRIRAYDVDLCDLAATRQVFADNQGIAGVVHFAALKSVGDSVENPLGYYENNLLSLINILKLCEEFAVPNFIFSSSCSIYGNISSLPVTEETLVSEPESPYAYTKLVGERIIRDFCQISQHVRGISLRYFNPVGSHASGLNGEAPIGRPNNLVPVITQTAAGLIPQMTVFGGDYPTRDGSCVRDYIHVTDIAIAHLKALDHLVKHPDGKAYDAFNLGSGQGVSVLEAIEAFERITGQQLNYVVGPRRPGDVVAIYSDCSKARDVLGWTPQYGIDEMIASAWKWQLRLNAERVNA